MRLLRQLLVMTLSVNAFAQVQPTSTNPFSDGARFNYGLIKGILSGTAAAMPEDRYGFRATPEADVRTFGQFVGHLADANYRICSIVLGQDPPMDKGLERTAKTKAELAKALGDSFAFCDPVYSGLTDAAGAALVKFDIGGEGTRQGPIQIPKLTALAFQVQHAFGHYGNLVTYMRMVNVVPPTSILRVTHQPSPAKPSATGYKDVTGDWNLVVQTPDGPVKATLSVRLDGNSLSADADSERGLINMSGSLSATEFKLPGFLQTLPVTLSGTPGIQSMSGVADFGGHALGKWTATRPQ